MKLALVLVAAAGCADAPSLAQPDLTPLSSDLAPQSNLADLARPGDLAYVPVTDAGGFKCGNMSCGSGSVCCVTGMTPTCAASCPDGGFIAQCRGPQDCGGNPCCINVTAGFMVHDVSCTTHQSDCPPAIGLNGSGQDSGCNSDGDCTAGAPGTMLPSCCTNTATGQHVCANSLVPGFTCP